MLKTFLNDLPKNYHELFIKEFDKRIYSYDTLESVERTRYHSDVTSSEEMFAPIRALEVKRENAFLWRKL